MKTKIIAAAILIAASLTILYSFKAQQGSEEKADFAVIKVLEPISGVLMSAGIFLSYGNGKTETAEFESLTYKKAPRNAETLHSYFVRMKKEGYKLKAATGGDYNSTYIFEKE
ncbi:MAG TPA: hypothetical protein VI757_01945 [Bacteroidia bacterium]|nr:hypothetical protein [Bacteroidia bacterium]